MKKIATLLLAALVTACSDGGSDPAPAPKPEPVPQYKYLSLSFDDGVSLESIHEHMWMFKRYDARVTFFASTPTRIVSDEKRVQRLRDLQAEGHEIGYHTTWHKNAPDYVTEHGLEKWLADEIVVGMSALAGVGIHPVTFAYPFGAHTDETDAALAKTFKRVRDFHTTGYERHTYHTGYVVDAYSIDLPYINMNEIYDAIDGIEDGKTLYLASHIIGEHPTSVWRIPIQELEMILSYAHSKGVKFCAVRDCP